jgi:hypothetical protein
MTTVVELQVDRNHLNRMREILIEIFEREKDLPKDIYFVPTPAYGTLDYETYYQHLRLHHTHVTNLRSFAITNIRDMKAEITIYDQDGNNPRLMTFEQALMSKTKEGTSSTKLFYSIEPTQASHTEGRYLLITDKESIKEAEQFIDDALESLNGHASNQAKVQMVNAPITRANRVRTSPMFQDYAARLRNMIPATIDISPRTPVTNAWKRKPPTKINLTDDEFPPLNAHKKPRPDNNVHDSETLTNTENTANETLSEDDLLDILDNRQQEISDKFARELETLRKENEAMQKEIKEQFKNAMQALEIRMEQRTQSLVASMGETLTQAVEHMNIQTAKNDTRLNEFLGAFQAQADRLTAQVDRMIKTSGRSRDENNSPNQTPVRRTRARMLTENTPDDWEMQDDVTDDESADGSRNSQAGRASQPNSTLDPTAGGRK